MENTTVSPNASVDVADAYADENNVIKLYCNVVEDDQITIKYEVVTQVNGEITEDYIGGTVSRASESLTPATGEAQGSTAAANNGYAFVGWYDNADCTGGALSTDCLLYTSDVHKRQVDGRCVLRRGHAQCAAQRR